jgi:hypothetical protein
MIWAGYFKKLLKVICGLLCLAFEITLGSGNEFLIRVAGILIIITFIMGCFTDQVKLTRALVQDLDEAVKEVKLLGEHT